MNLTYIIRKKYRTRQTYTKIYGQQKKKTHLYARYGEFCWEVKPTNKAHMCKMKDVRLYVLRSCTSWGESNGNGPMPKRQWKGKGRKPSHAIWAMSHMEAKSSISIFVILLISSNSMKQDSSLALFPLFGFMFGSVIYSAPQQVRGKGHNQHLFLPHQVIPRLGLGGGGGGHSGVVGAFGHHMTWLKQGHSALLLQSFLNISVGDLVALNTKHVRCFLKPQFCTMFCNGWCI